MDELSAADINKFLDPLTFARTRSTKTLEETNEDSEVKDFGESNAITRNVSESVNVLRSAFSRLETILSNIATVKNLSEEAIDEPDSSKRDEAFAKIRSLTAGIDVIVDQSRFRDQRILDGSPITLASGLSGQSQKLELESLQSFEDLLGLAQSVKTANVFHSFSENTKKLNANSKLAGLDISQVEFSQPDSGSKELEDGNYRIHVEYAGENSTVHLTNTRLVPIKTLKDVDLSGNGAETIDFGNGVKITFDKTTSLSAPGVDKFDFEQFGPESLFADLSYTQIFRHDLLVDGNVKEIKTASVETTRGISPDEGRLNFESARVEDPADEKDAVAAGKYSLRLNYFGTSSNLTLRDETGRFVGFKTNIDLSGEGIKEVEFDNGLIVSIDRSDLGNRPEVVEGSVEVKVTDKESRLQPELTKSSTAVSDAAKASVTSVDVGSIQGTEDALGKGKYTLKVRYLGKNSIAQVHDTEGRLLLSKGGLDLSQAGATDIDLGSGLKFTFNNDGFGVRESAQVDATFEVKKADPEPTKVTDLAAKARLNQSTDANGATGSIGVTGVAATLTALGEETLEEGTYTVDIKYLGKNSLVTLKDEGGRPIKFIGRVDLTQAGEKTIDLEKGVSITVNNKDFDAASGEFEATFKYQATRKGASATFDFEAYAKQAADALEVVQSHMNIVDDTFFRINQVKILQDELNSVASNTTAPGVGVISLLSSSVDSNAISIFRPTSNSAQINANIQQIIASAGTENQPRFSAADLISSAANQSSSSVLSILKDAAARAASS